MLWPTPENRGTSPKARPYFGISRDALDEWRRSFKAAGEQGFALGRKLGPRSVARPSASGRHGDDPAVPEAGPRHHVQIDDKFLNFVDRERKTIRRFQYTAIDGGTRILGPEDLSSSHPGLRHRLRQPCGGEVPV